jgi:hypothetical protein
MLQYEYGPLQLMYSFVFSMIMACFSGYYADRKGRSFIGWFVLGFVVTIFAPLILYYLPSLKKDDEAKIFISTPTQVPDSASSPVIPDWKLEEDKLWYYLDRSHEQVGPVSIIALRDLWARGLLELNSYVWSEGMDQWQKVAQLPSLREALSHHDL